MSQELTNTEHHMPAPVFGKGNLPSANLNTGAVAIEQERAIAEVQGQLILAKRFPRDLNAAYAELMESCSLMAMAEQAFWKRPQGGKEISGPSIRLAEEIARVFGNYEYGHRELSRGDGKSEVEVFGWDKQTNNRSIRQITVMHTMDTRDGPRKLRDQSEIDNRIANIASKQARGRILAMMPKWLVQSAIDKCKETLAGTSAEPISVRVRKMTQAFSKYGVTTKMLEDYMEHKLDDTNIDELVDLTGIFNALKDGGRVSDYFTNKEAETASSASTASKLADTAKAGNTKANSRPKSDPTPAAEERKPVEQSQEKPEQEIKNEERKPAEKERKPVKEAEPSDAPSEAKPDFEQAPPVTAEDDPEDLF